MAGGRASGCPTRPRSVTTHASPMPRYSPGRIIPPEPISQEQTATVLRQIASIVDRIDDGEDVFLADRIDTIMLSSDTTKAWVYIALLIVDEWDISTGDLRSIASKIFKGVQGVF